MMISAVYVAVIAAVVLTCSADDDSDGGGDFITIDICAPQTVKFFQANFLCHKILVTIIAYGIDVHTTYIAANFDCDGSGLVKATEVTFVNNVPLEPRSYTLADNGAGVLNMTYDGDPFGLYYQYIFSYTENEDCTIKITWVQCPDVIGSPLRISVISDYAADITDEWTKLNARYPKKSMLLLPEK